MVRGLALSVSFLFAACFTEPPPISTTGTSTSGDASTGTQPGMTTGSGPGTSASFGSGSATASGECLDEIPVIDRTGADIVVVVDPAMPPDDQLVTGLVIAGAELPTDGTVTFALLATLGYPDPIPPQCTPTGCDMCEGGPGPIAARVEFENGAVPIDPLDAFEPPSQYDCLVDREKIPPNIRHTVLVTDRPEAVAIENPFAGYVGMNRIRFHLACPGCGPASSSDAHFLALSTGGRVVDFGGFADHLLWLAAPRRACNWDLFVPEGASADDLQILMGINDQGTLVEIPLEEVPPGACVEADDDGDSETPIQFFRTSDDRIQLCPFACLVLQLEPVEEAEIVHTFCPA